MTIGEPLGLRPGHTSSIRRIEGGMLSYHADMDQYTNPYELGLGRLVDLDMAADFIGKEALTEINQTGVSRQQIGIEIDCPPLSGPNTRFWPIFSGTEEVGYVTSAVYSPRLECNIALAMVNNGFNDPGTSLEVKLPSGNFSATVVPKPFYDPKKRLAAVGS